MTKLTDIDALNNELNKAIINQAALHDSMKQSRQFYKHSAFFELQAGQARDKNDFKQNLLQVFADKNIEYTSVLPTVKVPTSGSDQQKRLAASKREKIIHAVRRASKMAVLQKKWAYDATIFAIAIAETRIDLRNRCVKVVRHDPRKVYWQMSNDAGDDQISVFWAVWSITAEDAYERYGVRPTKDGISLDARKDVSYAHDGKTYFTEAIRFDGKTRTHWVGDKFIEEAHNHLMGEIPIDVCAPIEDADDTNHYPGFYLDPLVPLQAELNDTFYRRSKIVRRMSSPVTWVRGMRNTGGNDDIKEQLAKAGGGVIGLSKDGEAGLLQVNENRLINDHEDRTINAMMRIAGYGNAAFGENVGANTSGDALGMYFNATQRKIENQWISWVAFHEAINAKVLRAYEKLLLTGETISITGYAPAGTLQASTDEQGNMKYSVDRGIYEDQITREDIAGSYTTVVIPPTATPHNVLDSKRLAIEAVNSKFMSRYSAYEEFGILSPEDELALLQQETQNPALNPADMSSLLTAAQRFTAAPTESAPSPANV